MIPQLVPKRPTPFEHQVSGAEWLTQRARAGLHDDMGYGKTGTTILALNRVPWARRGIVICNATIKENWRREILIWSDTPRSIIKGSTLADLHTWLKFKREVMIVSYEMATRWLPILRRQMGIIDFLIVDEAHKLKNADAQRTKAIKGEESDGVGGIAGFAGFTWELTGTPIPNDPIDLYTFLKFCGRLPGMQRHDFVNEFFFVKPGRFSSRQTVRPERQEALQSLIREVSLRRTGVINLPPILITNTYLDGETSKVAQFMRDHPGLDRAIIRALDGGNLNLIDSQHVMTLRRLIGEAKALPFAHYLLDLIEGGLKSPVIFGWHISVMALVREFLAKKGYKFGLIDGSVSERNRNRAVDDFQSGSLDGICCNIQAGGEGITLTRAERLFMLESGWTPKDNSQPVKRIHRIGQTKHTRAEFVTLAGSFDENIVGIVREKVRAIFEVDGQALLAAPAD